MWRRQRRDQLPSKERTVYTQYCFGPPAQKPLAVRGAPLSEPSEDAESQRLMTVALSLGLNVNRERKDWVVGHKKKPESAAKPFNPYERTALKDSRKMNLLLATTGNHANTSKDVFDFADAIPRSSAKDQLDIIDKCLNQVKSDGFVRPQTKIQRINGKIKSHVPKGMVCMVCNESLKEVRSNFRRDLLLYSLQSYLAYAFTSLTTTSR